jgi:hypothetical protein
MLHGINHHAHGRNILPSVKSLQNIEETISNILGVSDDQEEESYLFKIPLFDEIRGKLQDIIVLFLSCTVVHHDIQSFALGGVQQPAIFQMFHQEGCHIVAALATMLVIIGISM